MFSAIVIICLRQFFVLTFVLHQALLTVSKEQIHNVWNKKFCIYLNLETGATVVFHYVFEGDRGDKLNPELLTWKYRKMYVCPFFLLMCFVVLVYIPVIISIESRKIRTWKYLLEIHGKCFKQLRYWMITKNDCI